MFDGADIVVVTGRENSGLVTIVVSVRDELCRESDIDSFLDVTICSFTERDVDYSVPVQVECVEETVFIVTVRFVGVEEIRSDEIVVLS